MPTRDDRGQPLAVTEQAPLTYKATAGAYRPGWWWVGAKPPSDHQWNADKNPKVLEGIPVIMAAKATLSNRVSVEVY